jgi:hypothetical protein
MTQDNSKLKMDGNDDDEDDLQRKILSHGFSNYCQQTTLHGWQYLETEPGLWRKIIWALVILISMVASITFMVMNIGEFVNATTVTSIGSTTASLGDITFPSVIICNVNQVTRVSIYSNNE